jgi:hypothetical protein
MYVNKPQLRPVGKKVPVKLPKTANAHTLAVWGRGARAQQQTQLRGRQPHATRTTKKGIAPQGGRRLY